MAVVQYQCSICKRQIDIVQNQQGLEWIGHCNITLGCRGTLFQVEVLPDYIRGIPTPDVEGLKNWVQRKVLFNYTQSIAKTNWSITHNLGTAPSVVVYINQPTISDPSAQVEVLPEQIIYNSDDQLTLIFSTAYSGIAQCIARASNPDLLAPRPTPPVIVSTPTIQLSNQGILTIATKTLSIGNPTNMSLTLSYTLGSSAVSTDFTYTASNVTSSFSSWSDISTVIIKGKTYNIRTFNVQTAQTVSGQVSNGSTVDLVNINSVGQFNISVVSTALAPINQFVVDGDYSLYFQPNTGFSIIGATTPTNNIIWVVESSSYNLTTDKTTISVTNNMTGEFGPFTKIICSGIRIIEPGEVLILLGTTPFTVYDKNPNAYVDFTAVNNATTQFDIFFQGEDLYANTAVETKVYPPIRSIN